MFNTMFNRKLMGSNTSLFSNNLQQQVNQDQPGSQNNLNSQTHQNIVVTNNNFSIKHLMTNKNSNSQNNFNSQTHQNIVVTKDNQNATQHKDSNIRQNTPQLRQNIKTIYSNSTTSIPFQNGVLEQKNPYYNAGINLGQGVMDTPLKTKQKPQIKNGSGKNTYYIQQISDSVTNQNQYFQNQKRNNSVSSQPSFYQSNTNTFEHQNTNGSLSTIPNVIRGNSYNSFLQKKNAIISNNFFSGYPSTQLSNRPQVQGGNINQQQHPTSFGVINNNSQQTLVSVNQQNQKRNNSVSSQPSFFQPNINTNTYRQYLQQQLGIIKDKEIENINSSEKIKNEIQKIKTNIENILQQDTITAENIEFVKYATEGMLIILNCDQAIQQETPHTKQLKNKLKDTNQKLQQLEENSRQSKQTHSQKKRIFDKVDSKNANNFNLYNPNTAIQSYPSPHKKEKSLSNQNIEDQQNKLPNDNCSYNFKQENLHLAQQQVKKFFQSDFMEKQVNNQKEKQNNKIVNIVPISCEKDNQFNNVPSAGTKQNQYNSTPQESNVSFTSSAATNREIKQYKQPLPCALQEITQLTHSVDLVGQEQNQWKNYQNDFNKNIENYQNDFNKNIENTKDVLTRISLETCKNAKDKYINACNTNKIVSSKSFLDTSKTKNNLITFSDVLDKINIFFTSGDIISLDKSLVAALELDISVVSSVSNISAASKKTTKESSSKTTNQTGNKTNLKIKKKTTPARTVAKQEEFKQKIEKIAGLSNNNFTDVFKRESLMIFKSLKENLQKNISDQLNKEFVKIFLNDFLSSLIEFQRNSLNLNELTEKSNSLNAKTITVEIAEQKLENKKLQIQITELQTNNEKLLNKINGLEQQVKNNLGLETENQKLINKINELEQQVKNNSDLETENQKLINKINELEQQVKNNLGLETENQKLINKINELKQQVKNNSDVATENQKLINKINELEQQVKNNSDLKIQNQELLNKINGLEQQVKNNLGLETENQKLINQINGLEQQVKNNLGLETENQKLINKINELKQQVKNNSDVATENQELINKISELQQQVKNNLSLETENQKLINKISELQQQVKNNLGLETENQKLINKINELEQQVKNNSDLETENQKLINQINELEQQVKNNSDVEMKNQELLNKINELEQQRENNSGLEVECETLEHKTNELQKNLDEKGDQLKEKDIEIQTQKNRIKNLVNQLQTYQNIKSISFNHLEDLFLGIIDFIDWDDVDSLVQLETYNIPSKDYYLNGYDPKEDILNPNSEVTEENPDNQEEKTEESLIVISFEEQEYSITQEIFVKILKNLPAGWLLSWFNVDCITIEAGVLFYEKNQNNAPLLIKFLQFCYPALLHYYRLDQNKYNSFYSFFEKMDLSQSILSQYFDEISDISRQTDENNQSQSPKSQEIQFFQDQKTQSPQYQNSTTPDGN